MLNHVSCIPLPVDDPSVLNKKKNVEAKRDVISLALRLHCLLGMLLVNLAVHIIYSIVQVPPTNFNPPSSIFCDFSPQWSCTLAFDRSLFVDWKTALTSNIMVYAVFYICLFFALHSDTLFESRATFWSIVKLSANAYVCHLSVNETLLQPFNPLTSSLLFYAIMTINISTLLLNSVWVYLNYQGSKIARKFA